MPRSIYASQIIVHNNFNISDYVDVKNLLQNDVVKVYDAAIGGNQLGAQTVGLSEESISIGPSLSSTRSSIFVTVTRSNNESARIEKTYDAEFSPPSNVTVLTAVGVFGNTINWSLSESQNVTTYYIFRYDVVKKTGDFVGDNFDKTSNTYTDKTAVPGTDYFYFVYSSDGKQTFARSEGVRFTTAG